MLCVVIVFMVFCFLGYDVKGLDLFLLFICVEIWYCCVFLVFGFVCFKILVGGYVYCWYFGIKGVVFVMVVVWCDYVFDVFFLFYLLWCNMGWFRKNLWFEVELLFVFRWWIEEEWNDID